MSPQEFSQPSGVPPQPQSQPPNGGMPPIAPRRPMHQPPYQRPNHAMPPRQPIPVHSQPLSPLQPAQYSQPTPAVPPAPRGPVTDEVDDAVFQSLNTADPAPFVSPNQAPPQPAAVQQPALAPPEPEPALPAGQPIAKLPRPKRGIKIPKKLALVALAALVTGGGTFAWLRYETLQNDPTRVFQSAMHAALSTSQVEITTTGTSSTTADLDFSVPTNILVSTKASLNINGSPAELIGYGSASKTYFSYQKLPAGVTGNVAAVAKGAWIQLRSKGLLPAGINANLSHVADPRYQAFGPIIFGNFLPKNANQLIGYAVDHNIYKFNPQKVKHTVQEGTKVFAYPITLDTGNLTILNQSAASSEGFQTGDVQAAINQLDNYKGMKIMIYITSSSHQFFGFDATNGNQTVSIRYSKFDSVKIPAEPQTKLGWANFAALQLQIEAAAAAHETPAQLDAERAQRLAAVSSNLADYFATNNAYPTFTQLNDPVWLQNNLAGLDPEALDDPLAVTRRLAAKPTLKNFAYQPTSDNGKLACDNVTQNCSHYLLTAILSTGKPYAVSDKVTP
ncbi:MAG TPA: hypothetical protein VG604_03925 [Candidatus Saccharimonadales bacterium]|nr:hypothetical protein [Candidatus Saccharimonadales bacterium]